MVNTVGLQYAKALFDLANNDKASIDQYMQNLQIIAQSIEKNPVFLKILNHPKITKIEKKEIFQQVYSKHIDEDLLYFMYVLVDNDRIEILNDITDAFQYLIEQANKLKNVTVFSKIRLTDDELNQLNMKLSKQLASSIVLNNIVDETISGGIRLEYDGYVLDDTLTSKLSRLKEVLKSK